MSNSSLYGTTGNVTVSAKNLTTLYNAKGGNVVTANVPDSDFTTLYTHQTATTLTKSYGNANVEAFLNSGTDGANSVQNIKLSGNIYVGGSSFLGSVDNVHIEGGTLNYVLATDGAGGLEWVPNQGASNITDYIHFDVVANGTGQTFTDVRIGEYQNVNQMSVMKNGVNIEPSYYALVTSNTLQINILLATGDTIDVLPSGHGVDVGGNITEIQYNGGGILSANSSFTFDQPTSTLTVGNIHANGSGLYSLTGANVIGYVPNATHANISDSANSVAVANVVGIGNIATINLNGNSSQYLVGNGAWAAISTGIPNYANNAGNVTNSAQPNITSVGLLSSLNVTGNVQLGTVSNVHITGGLSGQVLKTNGSGNLSWGNITTLPGGANTYVQFNDAGNLSGYSTFTFNKSTGTLTVPTINSSNIANLLSASERAIFTGGVSGVYSFDATFSSVVMCTTPTVNHFIINFTNLFMNVNDVRSFAFINQNVGTGLFYCIGVEIAGVAQTVNWSGGAAPITATLLDIYSISIIKTSVSTYSVFVTTGVF